MEDQVKELMHAIDEQGWLLADVQPSAVAPSGARVMRVVLYLPLSEPDEK